MSVKIHLVMGTALALPFLAPVGAVKAVVNEAKTDHNLENVLSSQDDSSLPIPLTGKQLDEITAGRIPRESHTKPFPPQPPTWKPYQPGDPGEVTTMALGEEGGGISPIYKHPL